MEEVVVSYSVFIWFERDIKGNSVIKSISLDVKFEWPDLSFLKLKGIKRDKEWNKTRSIKSFGNIFGVVSEPHGSTAYVSKTKEVSSASGLVTTVATGLVLNFELIGFAAPESET